LYTTYTLSGIINFSEPLPLPLKIIAAGNFSPVNEAAKTILYLSFSELVPLIGTVFEFTVSTV
jgi:hypothetical protein